MIKRKRNWNTERKIIINRNKRRERNHLPGALGLEQSEYLPNLQFDWSLNSAMCSVTCSPLHREHKSVPWPAPEYKNCA
jgi:hypothetical protein